MANANSCLYLPGVSVYYHFSLSKWTIISPSQDDFTKTLTLPVFEEMLLNARQVSGTSVCGKIIGFFTLKKQTTIVVETESHMYNVLLARSLSKLQSVKLQNIIKKIGSASSRDGESTSFSSGIFERSIPIKSGHMCNFTGIQNSFLYLNEGLITNSPPQQPLSSRHMISPQLQLPVLPAAPLRSPTAIKVIQPSETSLTVPSLMAWSALTPPLQSFPLSPPQLVQKNPNHGAGSASARTLFTEFDDTDGTVLGACQYD